MESDDMDYSDDDDLDDAMDYYGKYNGYKVHKNKINEKLRIFHRIKINSLNSKDSQ
jgi:hypothetical protein